MGRSGSWPRVLKATTTFDARIRLWVPTCGRKGTRRCRAAEKGSEDPDGTRLHGRVAKRGGGGSRRDVRFTVGCAQSIVAEDAEDCARPRVEALKTILDRVSRRTCAHWQSRGISQISVFFFA